MLWVDKYRPTDLKKMDYHAELSSRLVELVSLAWGHSNKCSNGSH
jgi:hypothetical protein